MNIFDKIKEYLISSRKELEAVTWPKRQDTIRYTAVVIAVSIIFAIFFGLLDLGLETGVEAIASTQPSAATTQPTVTPTVVPTVTSSTVVTTPATSAPVNVAPGLQIQKGVTAPQAIKILPAKPAPQK